MSTLAAHVFPERLGRLAESPRVRQAALLAVLVGVGALWGAAVAFAGLAAVLICVSLIACAFCLYDFRCGVVLLVVIMPVSSSYFFPHAMFGISGLNPLNLLLVATLLSYVLRFAGQGVFAPFGSRALYLLYALPIVAFGLLGMSHVREIPSQFREFDWIEYDDAVGYLRDLVVKPLFLALYAALVAAAIARSRAAERFLTPMLVSMWVMGLMVVGFIVASGASLAQLAGSYERHFLSPLGMHANDLGRLYATAYALLLFVWDRSSGAVRRTVLFCSMGVVVAALILTFSRGAFFGFIVVNVIYLLSRRKLKTMLLAAAAIALLIVLMPGAVWSRMDMGVGQGMDEVSAGRWEGIWLPLVSQIENSPIWGHGLQSVIWSTPMRFGQMLPVTHPHSAYLQALLDGGVIALVLMLAFWMGHVWRGFRGLVREPSLSPEMQGFFEGAAAGLLSFVLAGFSGSSFFPVPEQSFLWLALGVMYGVRLRLAAQAKGG